MFEKLNDKSVNKGLHWTTIASEKVLLAIIGISTCIAAALYCYEMFLARQITLPDLFMLFIYAEILGMVGAFYSTSRIPVTLPIIIAITALCRLIVMQNKELDSKDLQQSEQIEIEFDEKMSFGSSFDPSEWA